MVIQVQRCANSGCRLQPRPTRPPSTSRGLVAGHVSPITTTKRPPPGRGFPSAEGVRTRINQPQRFSPNLLALLNRAISSLFFPHEKYPGLSCVHSAVKSTYPNHTVDCPLKTNYQSITYTITGLFSQVAHTSCSQGPGDWSKTRRQLIKGFPSLSRLASIPVSGQGDGEREWRAGGT